MSGASVRPKKMKSLLTENDAVKYQEHLRDFSDFDRKKPIKFKKSYIDIINEKRYNFTKNLSRSIKKGEPKKGEEPICVLCEFTGNKKQETTEEAQMSKAFFNEIETYIRLRPHTGICKFDGYYLIPQNTIVVENFPNGSLSDIYGKLSSGKSLSESGRFQWNNLMKAKIIFGTACSMMHLHANKIFHANLQPSQIYFDKNWEPQLTGYTNFYPDHIPEKFDDYEEDDEFREIYPYIPPEILKHKFDSKFLKKADVFSFGVLSYTVITDGEKGLIDLLEEDDFYEKYNSGELRPEFPDDISPLLKGIIIKSWDPDPSKRPLFSQIIKALQNNKEIFPDMDIGAYEIYQDTCFENIDIPPEDLKLLTTKAAPERPKDDTAPKRKSRKPERKVSSTSLPKPKPIEELTNSELGGSEDFGDNLAKAQEGKADALVAVGYALHKGNGCKKNDYLAYQFFKKAAEKNSQTGMYNCAMLMSTGCGTEKNEKKAMEMMKEATGIEDIDDDKEDRSRWYSKAIITYAQMLESADDDDEAEKYFKAAIDLKKDSDGDSYYTYAKFLEKKGKTNKALENYLTADKKGHKMAANDYAVTLLSTDDGEPPSRANVKKAIDALKKASQHNQPVAAVNYGNILYRGKYGQKTNIKEAIKLFQKAAEKDYPEGCFMYGYVLSHKDSGIDMDLDDAKVYFKKAAEQGHTIAMVQLARILQDEDEDYEEAAEYLKRGAELKDPIALLRYGECFENGKGVKKDKEKAMKYYQEAADKGNEQAKKKLKKKSSDESDEDSKKKLKKKSSDESDEDSKKKLKKKSLDESDEDSKKKSSDESDEDSKKKSSDESDEDSKKKSSDKSDEGSKKKKSKDESDKGSKKKKSKDESDKGSKKKKSSDSSDEDFKKKSSDESDEGSKKKKSKDESDKGSKKKKSKDESDESEESS